jgi:preprotein translocase subunit SecF
LFKNNIADEADFCEAYKSQILNNDVEEKESPIVSILIILFLLALIIALSIFGYNYIMDNKSNDVASSAPVKIMADEELKVTAEIEAPIQSKKEFNTEDIKKVVVKSFNELPKSKSVDIDDLADKVKIDMSESEEKNDSSKNDLSKKESSLKEVNKKIEEPLAPVTDSVKSTYVEDLAKLTAEIDKERE